MPPSLPPSAAPHAGAPSPETRPLHLMAGEIRHCFLRQDFGGIWFWRFAVVRPHDQGQHLTDCQVEGDGPDTRLVLTLEHASGQGHTARLDIWQPEGLSITGQGLHLARATRLRFGPAEAWPDTGAAGQYRIRTAQGEGGFPMEDAPALLLQV